MGNVNISIYLNDQDYVEYINNKKELNKLTRDYFKMQLARIQQSKIENSQDREQVNG